MFGPMNKGAGTSQPPTSPMQMQPQVQPGGQPQGNAAMPGGLAALFQNLQQPQQMQVPQIDAPQYGPPPMPSPEQAMAATRARMLARTPPVAATPATAPVRPQPLNNRAAGGNR